MESTHTMIVRVKLMGTLKAKSPPGGTLELAAGATIGDALLALHIDPNSVQVFTVNGSLERNRERKLAANDELSILPPVGGG